ncbi:hypothetical protein MAR_023930 [Mya arenaria]|uniref:IgGFc-binding protein N-terminal domain-containing protein n=2 Tax=Mya arenaria TaxID=6604 RepID=A0ABY7DS73_MYAAR|nr:hypothetical protein MAR_023930 [Mya arenaria]
MDTTSGAKATPSSIVLRFTADSSTRVTVSIKGTNSSDQTKWGRNGEFTLPASTLIIDDGKHSNRAVIIHGDHDFSLLAVYQFPDFEIPTPVLPTAALETDYTVTLQAPSFVTSEHAVKIVIVALNDSSYVTLQDAGIHTSFSLKQNDVQIISSTSNDFSGVRVHSRDKIAVFAVASAGFFQRSYQLSANQNNYARSVFMQVVPFDNSALRYILVPMLQLHSIVRIYARDDNTSVTLDGFGSPKTVHVYKEIFYETSFDSRYPFEITSTKPIIVTQTPILDHGGGKLFTLTVPAVTQYSNEYGIYGATHAYVFIPSSESSGILVDAKPLTHVPDQLTIQTVNTDYVVMSVPLSHGHTKLSHIGQRSFGLLVYNDALKRTYIYSPRYNLHSIDCFPSIGSLIG